jgi:hypothetical protein
LTPGVVLVCIDSELSRGVQRPNPMRRISLLIVLLLAMLVSGCFGGSSAKTASTPTARSPVPVVTGVPDQIEPAASESTLSWSQWSYPRGYDEYLRVGNGPIHRIGARPLRLDGIGPGGTGGGISGTTLVYARSMDAKLPASSLIGFYDIATHTYSSPPAGWNPSPGERFWNSHPSISGRFVLFARHSVDPDQLFQEVYLGDRTTGALTQLASGANLAAGQVNGNYAVWEQCDRNGVAYCSVYRYDIAAKKTTLIPNRFIASGRFEYAPSVTATGTVYFIHSGNGCGTSATLVRQPLGGSDTVLVTFKKGVDVGSTFVDDTGGTPSVYYSQSSCTGGGRHGDVYKITD